MIVGRGRDTMFKILIGDDHAVIRKGLRQILQEQITRCEVDEASNGVDVVHKINEKPYDILILDISLPKRNGMDILRQLSIEKPKLPVLILSISPEEQIAVRVLQSGASGFINKASAPEELIEAIRTITRGGKYVSPVVAEQLTDGMLSPEKSLHEQLSEKEYRVMLMIASGNTMKEMAEKLSVSVKTVGSFRNSLLDKMEVDNNAKLTKYVLKHNLL